MAGDSSGQPLRRAADGCPSLDVADGWDVLSMSPSDSSESGHQAPSVLALRIAVALHADSDHGRDGEDLELTGGPRSVCNCIHKARIAASVLVHVGYQWCDDGKADGGLLPLDTSLALGDSRCKPVYRERIASRGE